MSDMMKKMDNSAGWSIIKIWWKAGLLILQNNSSHTDTHTIHTSFNTCHTPTITHMSHTITQPSFPSQPMMRSTHYILTDWFQFIHRLKILVNMVHKNLYKNSFCSFQMQMFGIKSIVKIKLSITEQCFLKNNFHKKERKKNWNHINTQTLTHWTHLNNIQSYFIMIH